MKYIRWSAEVQCYLRKVKNMYFSIQINYATRQFEDTSEGYFFKSNKSDVYTYDKTSISSPILKSIFKFGTNFKLSSKFFIDPFVGFGVTSFMTNYYKIDNIQKVLRPGILYQFIPYSAHRFDKTIIRLSATGGFRLHYSL